MSKNYRNQFNITASNYSNFDQNNLETINKSNQDMLKNMQNRVLPEHKERLNYDSLNRNLEISNNFAYQTSTSNQQPPQPSQQYQLDNKNISILDRALDVNQQWLPVDFNGRLEYDNAINRKDERNNSNSSKNINTQNSNQFYGVNGLFKK
jgi:hypothetical protein